MAIMPVKWYSALMNGAPDGGASYFSNAGFGAAFLDAILVDGFGLVTLDGISVASNVATASRSAGVTFLVNQIIEISGATPSGLNGQWRVKSVDNGTKTFTFDVTGVSDGSASGTITCKTPGLGWERVFSSGNLRVYRSQNTNSPRSYFRFDDSDTAVYGAKLACYESMTDINTGFNSWNVSYGNSGIARPAPGNWAAFGDDRTFFVNSRYRASTVYPECLAMIGDYISLKPNDQRNDMALVQHCPSSGTILGKNLWAYQSSYDGTNQPLYSWLHDDAYGNRAHAPVVCRTVNDASGYGGPTFPSVADNGLFVTEHWFREQGSHTSIRGKLRGAYWVLANAPMSPSYWPTFIEGVVGLENKLCGLVSHQTYVNGALVSGRVLFDLTGPWEE